jgi:hypothetical protein
LYMSSSVNFKYSACGDVMYWTTLYVHVSVNKPLEQIVLLTSSVFLQGRVSHEVQSIICLIKR